MSSSPSGIQFRPNYNKHKQIFDDLQGFEHYLKLPMNLCSPINHRIWPEPNNAPELNITTKHKYTLKSDLYTIISLASLKYSHIVEPISNIKKYYIEVILHRNKYTTHKDAESARMPERRRSEDVRELSVEDSSSKDNNNTELVYQEETLIKIYKPKLYTGNYKFKCYRDIYIPTKYKDTNYLPYLQLPQFTTEQIIDILEKLIKIIKTLTNDKPPNDFAIQPTSVGVPKKPINSESSNSVVTCEYITYFFDENPKFAEKWKSAGSKLRKTRRNKTRKSRKNRRKSVRRVSKKV